MTYEKIYERINEDVFVVCVDKATCTEFIAVEYIQDFGIEGIWRYM